jgi:hypothetical protein
MAPENVIPEKQISEFVTRLQQGAGANLVSVILYGSAASGGYDPEFSNINLLCVLQDTSLPKLLALAPVVEWWTSCPIADHEKRTRALGGCVCDRVDGHARKTSRALRSRCDRVA